MLSNQSKKLMYDKFIANSSFTKKDLENLSVQGNIFLLKTLGQLEQNAAVLKRSKLFEDNLLMTLSKQRVLYVLYDNATKYPYYDEDRCIEIFSNKEGANQALEFYNTKMHRDIYVEGIPHKNFGNLFGDMYRLGLKNILIDKGQFSYKFKREDILEEPKDEDLVMIPETMEACINFIEEMCWQVDYEGKEAKVDKLEEEMFYKLASCQFIVPVHKNTKKVLCARVKKSESEEEYIPAFSDWIEFEMAYDSKDYDGMMMTLDDIVIIIREYKYEGTIINMKTMNFILKNNILEEVITY